MLIAVAICSCSSPLQAEVTLDPGAKEVKKIEVTQSMIGYRDTLRFYVFAGEKAVLVTKIGNANTEFPVSANLYVFPADTTAEGLDKWINNQHSDGLFPEVPEPVAVHKIPAASCSVKSHERIGEVDTHDAKFNRYSVTFEIKDVPAIGDIKIEDFTDTASVHVKVEAG